MSPNMATRNETRLEMAGLQQDWDRDSFIENDQMFYTFISNRI